MELTYEKTRITVNEAALLTGVKPDTIKYWIHYGKIKATKEVVNGQLSFLIDKNEIIAKAASSKCKKCERHEIEEIIDKSHAKTREAWQRYSKIGPVSDRPYRADAPLTDERIQKYRERDVIHGKEYYKNNKERLNSKNRVDSSTKWRKAHKDKQRECCKRYYQRHHEKILEYGKKYRERKKQEKLNNS